MAFIVKTAKTLRNHWKKSTFAAIAAVYGYNYALERLAIQDLMRVYCKQAAKYGADPLPSDGEPRNVTVILNSNANRRKAADEFEKYCAPLLHLAGVRVDVIKTEKEGHAKTLINDLETTDAIVVAGGDGTLSEVVTGLLRRTQENTDGLVPLGILPLGRTNTVGKMLFPSGNKLENVRALADATMAVVEQVIKPIDVLRVELIEGEHKPIYAVSGIKWGAYRDAEVKRDNYWLYGSLRKYATYLFNGYRSSLSWKCTANLNYSPPCSGCSNCSISQHQTSWFQRFSNNKVPSNAHVINAECQSSKQKDISTVDFSLSVAHEDEPKLVVQIGPQSVGYFDFVQEGWKSENGQPRKVADVIEARSIQIVPKLEKSNTDSWFSIDNESFELNPVRVTLLPKLINVFCKKENPV